MGMEIYRAGMALQLAAALILNIALCGAVAAEAPSGGAKTGATQSRTEESARIKAIDAAIAARRQQLIEWSQSASNTQDPKYRPYDILAATARDGCGGPERAGYMADLGKMGLTDTTKPFRFEMFALPPLVRYLYMYGQCMSDAQKEALLRGLSTTRRRLSAHGTLNHMMMQDSSWYLLAQYFPDARWTDWDGKQYSSAEVMALEKRLLLKRDWRFFQTGSQEMLSPTYSLTNLFPLPNLIDFAKDPEVAERARNEASLEVLLLKAHSFHGEIMPPYIRRNVDQTNAPLPDGWQTFPSIGQHTLWYYFGEPASGSYDFFQHTREPNFAIMLALSSWRPPLAAWTMPDGGYTVRYVTPDFSHFDDPAKPVAYGDTYIGHDYALATGNMIFDPKHYNDHNQTFAVAWKSDARRNLLECQQPYWRSNEGEDAWTTDFWSPFVQTVRIDNQRAVLLASIPERDPWTVDVEGRFWTERDRHKDALIQMVQCRIPRAVDQTVVEKQWTFFRSGKVYVALGSLKGDFETSKSGLSKQLASNFHVVKLRAARTALFVMVDDSGGSFKAFQRCAKSAAPSYDDTAPAVSTRDAAGRQMRIRFVPPAPDAERAGYWRSLPEVTVNGVVQTYRDAPVFETPFLKLEDGELHVNGPDGLELRGPTTH